MTLYERSLYVVAITLLLVGFWALHSHNEVLETQVSEHGAAQQSK